MQPMSRRFVLAACAAALITVPLGGCPLDGAMVGPLSTGTITTVKTNLDPAKATVSAGEVITLWIETNLPSNELSYSWSASGGSLSSSSGNTVRWTAGGSGRVRVSCTISSGANSRQAEYLFTVR